MNNEFLDQNKLTNLGFKSVGSDVKISKNITIIGASNITLGTNVRIDDYTIISAANGSLVVGSNVHIGGQSYFGCSGNIKIGNNVNISQGSKFYSKINKYLEFDTGKNYTLNKITIEDNVIIGSGCVIIGECNILEGATVGALSFVKGNLNSWSIYAGNPVKFIKTRKN
jgi:galactoside O-acetyltransferase